MAVQFVGTSSHRIVNSATPVTTVPFTIGMWAFPGAVEQTIYFSLADTAGDAHFFAIGQAFTSWSLRMQAGGASIESNITSLTVSQWCFIVARFISSTSRRLSVLRRDGSAGHVQNTSSMAPSGIDAMALGCKVGATPAEFMTGSIGEFWFSNSDIQADGGQLDDSLLRQLAYGGPFSVPHIAKDIIEYRSLRKHPSSDGDALGDVFHGASGRQTWVNINGSTIGSHPPLPYWYVKPEQTLRALVF